MALVALIKRRQERSIYASDAQDVHVFFARALLLPGLALRCARLWLPLIVCIKPELGRSLPGTEHDFSCSHIRSFRAHPEDLRQYFQPPPGDGNAGLGCASIGGGALRRTGLDNARPVLRKSCGLALLCLSLSAQHAPLRKARRWAGTG